MSTWNGWAPVAVATTAFEVFMKPAGIMQAFNYVRFISPVKAGSRVRNRIKLLSAEEKGAQACC